MNKMMKLLSASLIAAAFAAPTYVYADSRVSVACTVDVTFEATPGPGPELYHKDFVVSTGAGFSDDFSTPTRQKDFSATVAQDAGNLTVSINYFADVSAFDSVSFDAKLKLLGGKGADSTSGNFTTVQSVVNAGQVQRSTSYTLTCRRA